MDKEILNCSKISVDCVYNDPVDIRCGGPEILGFDFFVKGNETESMIIFIKKALNEANIPLISIGVVEKNIFLRENQVWTKEKIVAKKLGEISKKGLTLSKICVNIYIVREAHKPLRTK